MFLNVLDKVSSVVADSVLRHTNSIMCRCDGLSDGRCPQSVNNRTVKLSQGDLMLCPSCDAVRFPDTSDSSVKRNVLNSTKKTGAAAVANPETKSTKPTKSVTSSDDPSLATNECLNQKLSDEYCPMCAEPANDCSIKCDICKCYVHRLCTNLQDDTMDKLLSIVQHTGWVCLNCRVDCHQKIDRLQAALVQVTEQFADVLAKVTVLEDKITQSVAAPTVSKNDASNTNTNSGSHRISVGIVLDISMEIHRTLADVSKRKCNIVISGLPEVTADNNSDDTDDSDRAGNADEISFFKLCEENFTVKPALSKQGCRRLGKPSRGQQPRKLSVHLTTESSETDLLAEARKLRNSDDPFVASNV